MTDVMNHNKKKKAVPYSLPSAVKINLERNVKLVELSIKSLATEI